ncbi:diacylglycerol/lipid kinase family protein [Thalassolituus pacificus]|uniref:Diacylglycerol kinase family lipid kinase n=1 Tax=Thalassolituus pacificus TaxID=2975440 RepID=A0A9X3AS48_9GAMM|nr:diacylglycerol kinase family lipid kinase [Thalassolituus pacificus]
MAATQVLIVFNPVSGSGNRRIVEAVQQALSNRGCDVSLYPTQSAGDATRYLAAYEGQLDVVAVAGGDGTINEVVNGLRERDNQSYRLALIPTGTVNVLAAELGIGKTPEGIADIILQGREKPIYLGSVNERRFVLMAGIGYDAWVVDNVDLALKKKVGKLAYVLSMLKQLRHFGKKTYQLTVDGERYQANSVVITNGRYYAGSFVLSRQADLSKPTTQVLMISGNSPLKFIGILLGLPLGIMEKMPGMKSVAARHVQIELLNAGTEREPVQADGDSLAELPLNLQMEGSPVRLLVP